MRAPVMSRARRPWRMLRGAAYVAIAGCAITFVALLVLTHSAWGLARLRRTLLDVAASQLAGSLHLGALHVGPGCAIAVDSVALHDAGDELVVATGALHARCAPLALLRGRLVVSALVVEHPRVVLSHDSSGSWNWSRVVRHDSAAAAPSGEPSRVAVRGAVRVHDGTVVLLLAGDGDTVRTHRWTGIAIDAPELRTGDPGTVVVARLARLGVESSDPPFRVRDARGSLRIEHGGLSFDLARIALARSAGHAAGRVEWDAPGPVRVDVTATLDTAALADFAWIDPSMPTDGGGRVHLHARSVEPSRERIDYALTELDLVSHRSHLRGAATIGVGEPVLVVRDVALDLAPLHSELLQSIAGGPLPFDLVGAFTGRVVARGGPLGCFVVDSAALRFADARVRGATSSMDMRGALDVRAPSNPIFLGLRLRADPADLRTLEHAIPSLRGIGGLLTGAATLDSVWSDVRIRDADLTYRHDAAAMASRARVAGRVTTIGTGPHSRLRFALDLDAHPLAPAALAHAYPMLGEMSSVDGRLRITGYSDTMQVAADVRGRGGAIAAVASIDYRAPAMVVAARGQVRGLDPRIATGRASLPGGAMDASFDVMLADGTPATRRGSMALTDVGGQLAGVALLPSTVRLRLEQGRLVLDTLRVASAVGTLQAFGALSLVAEAHDTLDRALRAAPRDTLHMALASDSLGALLALVRGDSSAGDSSTSLRDSLRGSLAAELRATGSVEDFDLEGSGELLRLETPGARAARVRVHASAAGLPRERRGRATLHVDSLGLGESVVVTQADADAATDDGVTWRLASRAWGTQGGDEGADTLGIGIAGSVRVDSTSVAGVVDSVTMRLPATTLRSTGSARFAFERGGRLMLDTLALDGTHGSSVRLAVSASDSTHVDAVAIVRDATLRLPPDPAMRDSAAHDATYHAAHDVARVDLDARVHGARADPVLALRAGVRGAALQRFGVDSAVVVADYATRVAHARLESRGAAGDARADVTFPATVSLAPWAMALQPGPLTGEVVADSLALISFGWLAPDVQLKAGVLAAHVQLGGSARRPLLDGSVTLRGGAFAVPALGTGMRDMDATIALAHDSIMIRRLSLRGDAEPAGRASVTGVVAGLADSVGPTLDLALDASKLPVLRGRSYGDAEVSAKLRLVGPYTGATLSGALTVDRAELRLADVGRAGVVGMDDPEYARLLDSLTTRRVVVVQEGAFLRGLAIDEVHVTLGPAVWLRSAEANVKLGGAVTLAMPAGKGGTLPQRLVPRGTVSTERGTYTVDAGVVQRTFQLEQGGVHFDGQAGLDPRLDINAIYAVTTANDPLVQGGELRIRAHLAGTLARPALTLSAADGPQRSEAELMSYLVTGQSELALGNSHFVEREVSTQLMSRGASKLAERVAGNMFDVVNVTAGAASSASSLGSTTTSIVAGSRLGVGKQLSARTFLTVSAGLCSLIPTSSGGSASVDATSFSDAIGVALDYRFRRDAGASLSSDPSTSALLCTSSSVGRGFAPTPRQWGADLFKAWRF